MAHTYPPVGPATNGPGLSPVELQAIKYMGLDVTNAMRRGAEDFAVEIVYRTSSGSCETGWLPLALLHFEWQRRPEVVAHLVQEAGGPSASKVLGNWEYVLDLCDDNIVAVAAGIWAMTVARSSK